MFRQQKLDEEEKAIIETNQKTGNGSTEKMELEEMKIPSKSTMVESATPSSSTPARAMPTEQVETCSKSPRPDVVSSTLSSNSNFPENLKSPSPKDRQMSKSMAMLTQIFPGKSQKVLEIKLREARGDVVKALEACAKHFDNVEQHHQSSHHGELICNKDKGNLSVLISKMGNLPQMPFFNIFNTDFTKRGEHFDV